MSPHARLLSGYGLVILISAGIVIAAIMSLLSMQSRLTEEGAAVKRFAVQTRSLPQRLNVLHLKNPALLSELQTQADTISQSATHFESDATRGASVLLEEASLAILLLLSFGIAITVSLARRSLASERDREKAIAAIELAIQDALQSENRFRAMFESTAMGAVVFDHVRDRFIHTNAAFQEMVGYSGKELSGMGWRDLAHPDDQSRGEVYSLAAKFGRENADGDNRYVAKDGSVKWGRLSVSRIGADSGGPQYTLAMVNDVTERKAFEQQLAHQAVHDALTGLANRVLLQDRLLQIVALSQRHDTTFALLLLDLDRFKEINDAFGHQAGDELLVLLAQRLTTTVRQSDTVARLGGDEFAIVLPETDHRGALQTAQILLAAISQPFQLTGQSLDVGGSIGIAMYPDHGETGEALLQSADIAMYSAKRSRNGYSVYTDGQQEESLRAVNLSHSLKQAIESGELSLHYQPKISTLHGQVVGAEALARWEHPELGPVPPDEFIGMAEQSGLIGLLTSWLIERALSDCQRWHRKGIDVPVSINLSMRSLHDHGLVDLVWHALRSRAAFSAWLVVEVTEGSVMVDPSRAISILEKLVNCGVGISIDDFGKGYSSLSYLDRIPAQEIKIDAAFVHDMLRHEGHRRIVRGAIGLGHDLGLKIVAEGVEDRETFLELRAMGCDVAQGYLIGRPMPLDAFETWCLQRPEPLFAVGSQDANTA